jgi:hypothetical protein
LGKERVREMFEQRISDIIEVESKISVEVGKMCLRQFLRYVPDFIRKRVIGMVSLIEEIMSKVMAGRKHLTYLGSH